MTDLANEAAVREAEAALLGIRHIRDVEVKPVRHLIKGVWLHPGYGMVGGGEKAMKTWFLVAMAVSVASGQPFLGRFPVGLRGPVLVLTGEGGASFWKRRARRVAAALGVELDDLAVSISDYPLRLDNQALLDELGSERYVLVVVDPLYSYVGGKREAGNVFDMGDLLSGLSNAVTDETSVAVGHHMNKAGSRGKPSITDLTQAGGREWVHNWLLLWDKAAWDPSTGTATTGLEVGSREGYGGEWEVRTTLGRFDDETCEHEGELSWEVEPAHSAAGGKGGSQAIDYEGRIWHTLTDEPWQLSGNEVHRRVGGRKDTVLETLRTRPQFVQREEEVLDARGHRRRKKVWGVFGSD